MQHQPLLKVKVTITHTYCNLYTLASRENMHAMNDSHFESQYCGGSCTPQAFLHLDLGKHDIIRNKRHIMPCILLKSYASLFPHLLNVRSLLRQAYRRLKYYCSRAVLRDTTKLVLDPCHSEGMSFSALCVP